jgi:hypothetical protein
MLQNFSTWWSFSMTSMTIWKQEELVKAYCNMSMSEDHSIRHTFQLESTNATVRILQYSLIWESCTMTSVSVRKQEMLVYGYFHISSHPLNSHLLNIDSLSCASDVSQNALDRSHSQLWCSSLISSNSSADICHKWYWSSMSPSNLTLFCIDYSSVNLRLFISTWYSSWKIVLKRKDNKRLPYRDHVLSIVP